MTGKQQFGHDGEAERDDDKICSTRSLPDDLAQLQACVAQAHVPTLLLTTAHLVRDPKMLRDPWRPKFIPGKRDGGYDPNIAAEIRKECENRLTAAAQSNVAPAGPPDYDILSAAANWLMGRDMDAHIRPIKNAVHFTGEDPCAPLWNKQLMAPDRPFRVVIIGAGVSGLLAAHRLKQARVPFLVLEKNDDVGGVWENNNYPGSRVDINSFVYSYSFAQKIWRNYFGEQRELSEYFREFARERGLYDHISFGTEVQECVWDEAAGLWRICLQNGERQDANILISAVGQLSLPKLPRIPGSESFAGPQFHSARWDAGADLSRKHVAVVGNAASAMQFIPRVAAIASQVTVYMRTPNWLIPQPLLHAEVGEAERWLMRYLPDYAGWYRAFELIPTLAGAPEIATVDPAFPPTEESVSAANAGLRAVALDYLEGQISDRPDLRPHVIPDYPIAAKRFVADNGTWIATLKRDNVKVERSSLTLITPRSIKTEDGQEHEADAIIYATGFRANEFLIPMDIVGRSGAHLHESWSGEARAYLGMTVPAFPNLFMLYGPNTNLLVNLSSAINFFEGQMTYVLDAIRLLLTSGRTSLEVKPDVFDHYNDRLDQASTMRTWQWSSVSTWYKGPSGRSAQNYPFTAEEFAQRTSSIDPTDYSIN